MVSYGPGRYSKDASDRLGRESFEHQFGDLLLSWSEGRRAEVPKSVSQIGMEI